MAKRRIVVVDDHPAFLQELVSLLEDFEIVGSVTDEKAALELIRRLRPNLIVLDLSLPAVNGIEVARQLAKHPPAVVFCSVETDAEIVEAARQAGALGYVFKTRGQVAFLTRGCSSCLTRICWRTHRSRSIRS